jgi:hypothetical protein
LPPGGGPRNPEFAFFPANQALPTLALDGPGDTGESGGAATAVRYLDLPLLLAALPVFIVADWPLLGYAVLAAVWIAQLGIELYGERRAARELRGGNRQAAMGWFAATTLGRVWLVALAVLLVGLLGDREDGLAAAVLAAILFTVHFGARIVARAMTPPEERLG